MLARREIELRLHLPHAGGGSAKPLFLLRRAGIPILTRNCYRDRQGLVLLLTTTAPEAAQRMLADAGYRCHAEPVVLIGPAAAAPLLAAQLCRRLMECGIGILYSHLCSVRRRGCFVICKTTDDERALQAAHELLVPEAA